jgi:ABC-2 type transport system permease protein
MLNFLRTTWLLYRTHLVRTLRARRMWLVAFGVALAPLIAWVVAQSPRTIRGLDVLTALGFLLTINVMAPLASVIVGAAVLGEELEDRTITYLLTRPISRPAILVGRWLASATVLVALFAVSAALLGWVAGGFPPPSNEKYLIPAGLTGALVGASALAVFTYSALFSTLGVFFKHPMIVGLGYAFTIEGFLANLPGKNQALTIQYYVRCFLASQHPQAWAGVEDVVPREPLDAAQSVRWLLGIALVALAVGALALRRKQYELTA